MRGLLLRNQRRKILPLLQRQHLQRLALHMDAVISHIIICTSSYLCVVIVSIPPFTLRHVTFMANAVTRCTYLHLTQIVGDPSIPFSYLYSLLGVLRQYIGGEVNDVSMKENFDVTLQLLEETFSAPYPVSTDASALQELVPTSSLFSKMLMAGLAAATQATSSVSGSSSSHHHTGIGPSGSMTPSSSGLFSSPLYWRRAGIKYAQNEIYFDINEEIKAVLDRMGQIVTGDVWGRIDCRCKLSGMPDVSLSLSNASAIDDPSFHPCVR